MHEKLKGMRTTIEIRGDQRARLLDLAARRGEKGLSRLISEAIDEYLHRHEHQQETRRRALCVQGALGDQEGEVLRQEANRLREHWR